MDKYEDKAREKLANQKSHGRYETHPEVLAQKAHVQGEFSSRVLDEYFNDVYGEVLVELFMEWLKTQPHETKTREFLYSTAMGLGSVRARMIQMETYGRNVPTMKDMEEDNVKGE